MGKTCKHRVIASKQKRGKYECSKCGKSIVFKNGHISKLNSCYHNVKEVVSKHKGYNMCKCSKCGEIFKNRYIEYFHASEVAFWQPNKPLPSELSKEEQEYKDTYGQPTPQMLWRREKLATIRGPDLFKQEYPASTKDESNFEEIYKQQQLNGRGSKMFVDSEKNLTEAMRDVAALAKDIKDDARDDKKGAYKTILDLKNDVARATRRGDEFEAQASIRANGQEILMKENGKLQDKLSEALDDVAVLEEKVGETHHKANNQDALIDELKKINQRLLADAGKAAAQDSCVEKAVYGKAAAKTHALKKRYMVKSRK